MPMNDPVDIDSLEAKLFHKYGPLLGGAELIQLAGFKTAEALKMAIKRKHLKFQTFSLPGRRGRFALTEDVARWLATLGSENKPQD